MILRKYPETPESLQKNFIVHFSSTDTQLKNHVSPLSIKCSMNGLENFKTPDGEYEVTTGTYLIVNNGQHCSGYTQKESEIFSIYLDSKFVEETLRSLVTSSGLFRKTYGISPEVCREYFRKYSAKYKIN